MKNSLRCIILQKITEICIFMHSSCIVKFIYSEVRKVWGHISTYIAHFQIRRNFFTSSKSMDPNELFLFQCNGLELHLPDITVRYMALKDIINGKYEDGLGLRLYRNSCHVCGLDPNFYVDKFTALVNSFATFGYNPDYYLLCDNKMILTNGRHRLTCALFFEIGSINVKNNITSFGDWNKISLSEWGHINAFCSDDEIDLIRHESDLLVERCINHNKFLNALKNDPEVLRKWIVKESKKIYNFEFYQSFPMLGLNGARPTDKRIEHYGLKELLNSKMDVLDTGCHIGFFDLEIASLVHSITGIELNPKISRLSLGIARKLSIYNAAFFSADFKEWESMSRRKYDIIFSFANYREVGLNSQEFVAKIVSLIKPSGYVLFEGYNIVSEANNDYEDYISAFTSHGFRSVKNEYIMDDGVTKRMWTLLQYNN